MHESDFQSEVSQTIVDEEVHEITVSITDNENAVIVELPDGRDAAYTADEARHLAESIKAASDQMWTDDEDGIVDYINELADVVDGVKSASEVET